MVNFKIPYQWIGIVVVVSVTLTFIIFYPFASCFAVMAGESFHLFTANSSKNFSFRVGISNVLVNGEGKEYAYMPEEEVVEYADWVGEKISDLRWETKNAWLIGGDFSAAYKNRLTFNIGYWTKAASGSGTHTDDDWLIKLDDRMFQTRYSEGRSELDKGRVWDVNGRVDFLYLFEDSVHFYSIAGYKGENWKWEEHDSYGIYFWEPLEGFEGDTITSIAGIGEIWQSSETGIIYEQEITIPYLGLGVVYGTNIVSVEAHAMYSRWVDIDVIDHHILRATKFKGNLEDGEYWVVGGGIHWNFRSHLALVGAVEFEELETTKGNETIYIFEDDEGNLLTEPAEIIRATNGVGAGYAAISFMLNIVYTF